MSEDNKALEKSVGGERGTPGVAEVLNTIKQVSDIADKRASTFLLSVGTGLLILTVLGKANRFSSIGKTEFISLLVVCLACLVCGAYVRMFQERLSNEHELRMLETSLQFSLKSQGKTDETALQAQDIAQHPIDTIIRHATTRPPGG